MKQYTVKVYDDRIEWYNQKGQCHREDGPAIEWANGTKEWYINGRKLTEQEFNNRKASCNGKIIEVDGKKYRLEQL